MNAEVLRHVKELEDTAAVEQAWKERLDEAEQRYATGTIDTSQLSVVYRAWSRARDEKARAEDRLARAHGGHRA
jgi:hypothetical protein